MIRWANAQTDPVLSLDTPSGLDVTTGLAADPCVAATATMTLALPKTGLLGPEQVGQLYLADISVPRTLYERMDIDVGPVFADDSRPTRTSAAHWQAPRSFAASPTGSSSSLS